MELTEAKRVRIHLGVARRYGTPATLTIVEWEQTIADFNGLCAYCRSNPYTLLEHFLPVYIAGTQVNNCLPACDTCNVRKSNRIGDDLIRLFGESTIDTLKSYLEARANGSSVSISVIVPFVFPPPSQVKLRPKADSSKYAGKAYLSYKEATDYLGIKTARFYGYLDALKIETHKFEFGGNKKFVSIKDIKIIDQVIDEPWMIEEFKEA